MKKLIQSLSILAFFMAIVPKADASILIEPVVGYSFATTNIETTVSNVTAEEKDPGSGLSYGGRLGWQNLGFQLGLDYLASNLSIDGDDLNTTEMGAFAGFEFPVLLRVYGGYVFSGTGKNDDIEFKNGTGPKVGVGFTFLPFLDINLEWRNIKYEQQDVAPATIDASYSALMLGFSLPFNI